VTIKAIETRYAGCHFRSRLEARWAVFFDYLGVRWEYEPEGFESSYGRYLPDFYLPDLDLYVEVKGSNDQLRADSAKIGSAIDYKATPVSRGLLLLGPVPDVRSTFGVFVTHDVLCWASGVTVRHFEFRHVLRFERPWTPTTDVPQWTHLYTATEEIPDGASVEANVWSITVDGRSYSLPAPVFEAYRAARSARFEHGYSGAS
jgi:hypothetical protein